MKCLRLVVPAGRIKLMLPPSCIYVCVCAFGGGLVVLCVSCCGCVMATKEVGGASCVLRLKGRDEPTRIIYDGYQVYTNDRSIAVWCFLCEYHSSVCNNRQEGANSLQCTTCFRGVCYATSTTCVVLLIVLILMLLLSQCFLFSASGYTLAAGRYAPRHAKSHDEASCKPNGNILYVNMYGDITERLCYSV